MSIFEMKVTEHAGQFGDGNTSERACLIILLQQAAQTIGAGRPFGTVNAPIPLILNGRTVGSFWAGSDSHTLQGR
jgi:hypothetical protein